MPSLFILPLSTIINFQIPPNLVWCFILHTLHCGNSFEHLHNSNTVLQTGDFFILLFTSRFIGMGKYFSILSFLPSLESFGLAARTPVGIRVLGVETPKELICSREEGYKTKLIPPCYLIFPQLLLLFFFISMIFHFYNLSFFTLPNSYSPNLLHVYFFCTCTVIWANYKVFSTGLDLRKDLGFSFAY